MEIAKGATIYGWDEIRAPWNVKVGHDSIIGDYSFLDGRNGLEIGENVNFSTGVSIYTAQHNVNDPYFRCNNKCGPVKIGNRAWVSTRSIILPKITIGEGCVVAAGAVVTKNCAPFSIMGGCQPRR